MDTIASTDITVSGSPPTSQSRPITDITALGSVWANALITIIKSDKDVMDVTVLR
jgi:hypothetical protein